MDSCVFSKQAGEHLLIPGNSKTQTHTCMWHSESYEVCSWSLTHCKGVGAFLKFYWKAESIYISETDFTSSPGADKEMERRCKQVKGKVEPHLKDPQPARLTLNCPSVHLFQCILIVCQCLYGLSTSRRLCGGSWRSKFLNLCFN